MIAFIAIIALIIGVSAELLPVELELEYGYAYIFSYTLTSIALFVSVPYTKMFTKTIYFIFCSWASVNCCSQFFHESDFWCNSSIFLIQTLVMVQFFIYMLFKSYSLPSDKYTKDAVYIVCKKPQNMLDFMFSFIAKPMSSISVVSNGIWFGYTFGKKYYQEPYIENDRDCYLKLSVTHEYVLSRLETLQNAKWSVFNNCCHAVIRLYPDIKISILNILPCFFIKQLMRYEND